MSDKVKKKIVKAAEKAPEPVEDDGLAALSALVRPSTVPPVAGSEASDLDDGKLDLRALAASLPSPEPMAPVAHDAHASDDEDDEDEEEEVTPPPKKAKKKKAAAAAEPAPRRAEVAEPAQSGGGGMWIGLAIVAVLGLGGAYYWYAFMSQGDDASASDALASSAPTSVSGVEEPVPDEEPSVEAVEPSVEEPAPAVAEAGEPVAIAEAAAEPEGSDRRRDRDRNRSRTGAEAAPAQAAPAQTAARAEAPTAPTPAAPQQGRNIDNMLDDALGGRPNAEGTGTEARPAERPTPPPAQAANGNLPNEPPRGDVLRILGRLMPQIRQCAGDQVGMANAVIVMRGDGSVATVSVGGSPFGGSPQGACMEGALRGARFPQFSQATYRVSYPFNIR